MKINILHVKGAQSVFRGILDKKINAKLAYKLTKVFDEIDKLSQFHIDQLKKILDDYAQKDENGSYKRSEDESYILIQEEHKEICEKEINELNALEVDYEGPLLTLEELEVFDFTTEEFLAIVPFIQEPEE